MGMADAQAAQELGEIVPLLALTLACLDRRLAFHEGLPATFAVFMGSRFVARATRETFLSPDALIPCTL